MKKTILLTDYFGILTTTIIFFSIIFATTANASSTNLILNPGFETFGANNLPINWTKEYWGNAVPTYKYPDIGRSLTDKSATITLSKKSTGDARWTTDAVSVSAGEVYLYNSWYKSNVATEINVEYTNLSSKKTYEYVLTLPSSGNVWKLASTTVKIPAGIIKAKFFNLIKKKGTLTVDDFSLVNLSTITATTTPPTPTEPPSILSFVSEPSSVLLGSSTTISWNAINVSNCNANGGWSGSKNIIGTEVIFPATTTTYVLNCNGSGGDISKQLTVMVQDPILISTSTPPVSTTTPSTWTEGVVAISFDDSWISQYSVVLPVLESNGIKGTFYITTEPIIDGWSDFMTPSQVKEISDKGHEIAGHTITHPHLPNLSQANLIKELTDSKTYLENLTGKKVNSFAYPYGEMNMNVKTHVAQAGYLTGRGVEYDTLNSSTTDKYNLRSPCILKSDNISLITKAIQDTKNNKELFIICLHEVKEGGDEYSVTPSQFLEIINQIKVSGVKTMTVQDATKLLFNLP